MNKDLVLTFDLGTQSMRGMFVDKTGNILGFEQIIYEQPYFSKNPGWAEQKPNFYFEILCKISNTLYQKFPDLMERVFAVTLTTIRDTVLCLDKDCKPLRDIILWLDKRETEKPANISALKKLTLQIAGAYDIAMTQYRQSVCNWIMEKEPEIWEKTYKYVMLSTYLNYLLTGNLVDSYANQIGHVPFDYKNTCWLLGNSLTRFLYDVPNDKLCDLVSPGDIIGKITKEVSEKTSIPEGLELIAGGSDKACETLGLSVITKDRASISLGTTATIHFATPDYFEPVKYAPAYPAVMKGYFNTEAEVYRGYWMISWFKKEFAAKECIMAEKLGISPEELLNKNLSTVPPGSNGLILQPFWSPGVVNPNSRGSIIGFSDVHTRIHIYRAIIEGIDFSLLDSMYTMEKRCSQKIKEIYVAGGGSQSDEICQITANIFGLPVKRIQTHEVAGLGSSIIAYVSKGFYSSYEEAVNNMVRVKDVFDPDAKEHEIYDKIFKEIYLRVNTTLEPLYTKIKKRFGGKNK